MVEYSREESHEAKSLSHSCYVGSYLISRLALADTQWHYGRGQWRDQRLSITFPLLREACVGQITSEEITRILSEGIYCSAKVVCDRRTEIPGNWVIWATLGPVQWSWKPLLKTISR
jgi:hypothetical protein